MISEFLKSTLPEYEIFLPKLNKKIKFRPMTVKQEKVLLLNQDEDLQTKAKAILNILKDCFYELKQIEKLEIIDVEKSFLSLRAKSVSEVFEFGIICPYTNENINIKTSIDDFKEIFDEHDKIISLNKDMKLIMNYPTFSYFLEDKKTDDEIKNLFFHCFKELHTKNDVINKDQVSLKDIEEFLDSMTVKQYSQILNFLQNIPHLENKITYKTKDGIERELILKGLDSFFELASVIVT
jgi:hypothetical protein